MDRHRSALAAKILTLFGTSTAIDLLEASERLESHPRALHEALKGSRRQLEERGVRYRGELLELVG